MEHLTPTQLWTAVLAAASATVLLSSAAEKIARAVQTARAPNLRQDDRLQALESRMTKVEDKLSNDHARFQEMASNNRVTQRALLALLDHGLDGNNIDQMQRAKEELQNLLINR